MRHTASALLDLWTEPQDGECLPCYVTRMLTDFGCDGTPRWTRHWRALRAPEVKTLDRTLRAIPCDCGVPAALGGASPPAGSHAPPVHGTPVAPGPPAPCRGVRRGSTKPCSAHGRPPPG
ncbi:DUF2695 domain-containing protein [Amycolatopsis thermophila]|uniref:DUF2695 domain-containing protein n=1 Tax=Amycolatopsis thermophila TaxID=206084 RepID=UPI00352131AE